MNSKASMTVTQRKQIIVIGDIFVFLLNKIFTFWNVSLDTIISYANLTVILQHSASVKFLSRLKHRQPFMIFQLPPIGVKN